MLSKPLYPQSEAQASTTKRAARRRAPVPKRVRVAEEALKGRQFRGAIDVEHTGGAPGEGETFAWAVVVAELLRDGQVEVVHRKFLSYQILTKEEHHNIFMFPAKMFSEAHVALWRHVWAAHKWDMDTFDEFWAKNLPMLHELLEEPTYATRDEFNTAVRDTLAEIEQTYTQNGDSMAYMFDTMHVDPVRTNLALERAGCKNGMNYYRAGRYGLRSDYLHSVLNGLLMGALRLSLWQLDYKVHVSPVAQRLRKLADQYTEHSHHPTHDAEHMLRMLIMAPDVVADYVDELAAEAAAEDAAASADRAFARAAIAEKIEKMIHGAEPEPITLYSDADMVVTAVPREFSIDLLVDGSDPALVEGVLKESGDPVQDTINAGKYFAATKGIANGTGKYFCNCGFTDPATAAANADKVLAHFAADPRILVTMTKTAAGDYRMNIESKAGRHLRFDRYLNLENGLPAETHVMPAYTQTLLTGEIAFDAAADVRLHESGMLVDYAAAKDACAPELPASAEAQFLKYAAEHM